MHQIRPTHGLEPDMGFQIQHMNAPEQSQSHHAGLAFGFGPTTLHQAWAVTSDLLHKIGPEHGVSLWVSSSAQGWQQTQEQSWLHSCHYSDTYPI